MGLQESSAWPPGRGDTTGVALGLSKTVCPGKQDMCEYRAQGRQHKLMAGYCSSPKGGKFRISATLGEGAGPASRNSTARALSR